MIIAAIIPNKMIMAISIIPVTDPWHLTNGNHMIQATDICTMV